VKFDKSAYRIKNISGLNDCTVLMLKVSLY
jgi:hypothetical protein